MTSWERLGIAPTTDRKAIKKAYAAKVKDCHQEDEPERWAQLHDAYKAALKYAEAGSGQEKKTYTAYREQGKDFLHGEQAKPVYRSPWGQTEGKIKLQRKEESKPEIPKEKPKLETPKEQPKPELRKPEPPKEQQKPEERKPEEPKPEEPKPEIPKEKPKLETPKEQPKPELRKPEPPKEQQKPEERKPEPPKEEPKLELPKPEPRKEEPKPEPSKEERKPEARKPEPSKEEAKPELPKPESPKEQPESHKEEAKPKPHKEETKREIPKEERKPKPPKEQPKPQDTDHELTEFFGHMLANARESEQKSMAQLRAQLEELSQAAPKEEAGKWREFLKSPVSQRLYGSEDYWSAVFAVFYKKELQKRTYQAIYGELQHILSTLSMEMPMVRSRIENCMKSCEKHMQRQEERAQKERQKKLGQRGKSERQNRRTSFVALCLFLLLLCAGRLLSCAFEYYGTNPEITSEKAVKTKLTSYLNEKYSTQKYQADAFELQEISVRYRYEDNKRKSIEVGYRATLPEQPDFAAIVLFQYDDEGYPEDAVCFDNVQLDRIEESVEAEVKGCLAVSQAVGFLSAGEGDMVAGAINPTDAVYHTFFSGEITAFMEEEEQVRGQIYQTYREIDMYSADSELNGSFILYYPDAQIPDLNALFTTDYREDGKDVAEKLKTLQEKLHIQMIAVKVPQSYYDAALKKNVQLEGRGSNIMRNGYSNTRLEVPLNPAFVSMWVMEYHSKSGLPVLSGEEESWVHVPKITELEEGIYALPRENSWYNEEKAEDVLHVEIDEKAGKILVDADGECQREYVIVLDKQILGIGDDYEVRRVNPEDAGDVRVYDSYPYNDIKDYTGSYNMFEGEDKLFIDYCGWADDELEIIWQP